MAKRKWEINCYEACKDGALVIYLEDSDPKADIKDINMSIVVPARDVDRLMYAAIDALQKKSSRR